MARITIFQLPTIKTVRDSPRPNWKNGKMEKWKKMEKKKYLKTYSCHVVARSGVRTHASADNGS